MLQRGKGEEGDWSVGVWDVLKVWKLLSLGPGASPFRSQTCHVVNLSSAEVSAFGRLSRHLLSVFRTQQQQQPVTPAASLP